MINIATANREEIVGEVFRVLEFTQKHKNDMSPSIVVELLEWFAGFVVRLSNDLQGIPHKTKEQELQEIRDIADHMQETLAKLKQEEKQL